MGTGTARGRDRQNGISATPKGAAPKGAASKGDPSPIALMDAFGAFMRSYKGWMRTVLAALSSDESNPSRVMLVVSLRRTSPQPMGSLAMHLGLPKSNITALVDDLEAEGVLRRKQDPTDRRVTLLELTPKGHSLCEREYDAFERSMAGLFALLPADERKTMFAGLERMTAHLREEDEKDVAKRNGANSLGSKRSGPAATDRSGTKSFKK